MNETAYRKIYITLIIVLITAIAIYVYQSFFTSSTSWVEEQLEEPTEENEKEPEDEETTEELEEETEQEKKVIDEQKETDIQDDNLTISDPIEETPKEDQTQDKKKQEDAQRELQRQQRERLEALQREKERQQQIALQEQQRQEQQEQKNNVVPAPSPSSVSSSFEEVEKQVRESIGSGFSVTNNGETVNVFNGQPSINTLSISYTPTPLAATDPDRYHLLNIQDARNDTVIQATIGTFQALGVNVGSDFSSTIKNVMNTGNRVEKQYGNYNLIVSRSSNRNHHIIIHFK